MRMLAVGDLHIGCHSRYFNDLKDPNIFVSKALKFVVDYARRNGIKHIAILGDNFDSPNPADSEIIFLITLMLMYPDIMWYVYPGNHDTEKDDTTALDIPVFFGRKLKVFPNIKFFSKPTQIVIDNVPVSFLPWPYNEKPKDFKVGVVFAHVTIGGTVMDNGYASRSQIKVEPGKDFWIIGDIHKFQKVGNRIVYPGTLYQTNYGEKLPKGFLDIDCSISKKRGAVVDWKFIPVQPPYTLNNITIEKPSDLKQITDNPTDLYKLKISEDVAISEEWFEAHPNVVDSRRLDKRLASLSDMDIVEAYVSRDTKGKLVTKNLTTFLEKKGLKPKRAERALDIVKEIVNNLKKA